MNTIDTYEQILHIKTNQLSKNCFEIENWNWNWNMIKVWISQIKCIYSLFSFWKSKKTTQSRYDRFRFGCSMSHKYTLNTYCVKNKREKKRKISTVDAFVRILLMFKYCALLELKHCKNTSQRVGSWVLMLFQQFENS